MPLRRRLRLRLFFAWKWDIPAILRTSLPLPVNRMRFAVPLWVFIFGITTILLAGSRTLSLVHRLRGRVCIDRRGSFRRLVGYDRRADFVRYLDPATGRGLRRLAVRRWLAATLALRASVALRPAAAGHDFLLGRREDREQTVAEHVLAHLFHLRDVAHLFD